MREGWFLGYVKTMMHPDTEFQQDIVEIPLVAKTREEATTEVVKKWQEIKHITKEDRFFVCNYNPYLCFREPLKEE